MCYSYLPARTTNSCCFSIRTNGSPGSASSPQPPPKPARPFPPPRGGTPSISTQQALSVSGGATVPKPRPMPQVPPKPMTPKPLPDPLSPPPKPRAGKPDPPRLNMPTPINSRPASSPDLVHQDDFTHSQGAYEEPMATTPSSYSVRLSL
jgi:hypothetical protein